MESIAKHQTVCDNCNTVLTENYSSLKGQDERLSIDLKVKGDNSDYPYHITHHFCDEACLASHLASRAKGKGKKIAKAAMCFSQANVDVDITAFPSYQKLKLKE